MASYRKRLLVADTDRSMSVFPHLTSETLQLVQDMDRQQTQDGGLSESGTTWQGSVESEPPGEQLKSKPWFYKKYSPQLSTNRDQKLNDGEVSAPQGANESRRMWPHSHPGVTETSTTSSGTDRDSSENSVQVPNDFESRQAANRPITLLKDQDEQLHTDELPIKAVDPIDFKEMTPNDPSPTFSSSKTMTLSDPGSKSTKGSRCKVVLITLSAEDIDDYRDSIQTT